MKSLKAMLYSFLSCKRSFLRQIGVVLFAFLFMLVLIPPSFGQISSENTWLKTYGGFRGGNIASIIETQDGGYTLVGCYDFNSSIADNRDTVFIKTNSFGETIIDKILNSGLNDHPLYLFLTNSGEYVIVGTTERSYGHDGDPVIPSAFYILKFDSLGNILLNETFVGGRAFSVAQASDGDFAVATRPEGSTDSVYIQILRFKLAFSCLD